MDALYALSRRGLFYMVLAHEGVDASPVEMGGKIVETRRTYPFVVGSEQPGLRHRLGDVWFCDFLVAE